MRGYNTPDWVANKEWTPDTTMVIVIGVGLRQTKDGLQPTDTPWDLGTLPIALDPEHVVIAALDARDVRTEPDVALDGYAHRVVSFTYGGSRVKLFLNPPGMLPKAVEITRARPYETYWAPWGDVTQRITFGMWTLEEGGIRFPRLWDYSTGGQPDGTVEITRVVVNPHVAADDFAIPEDLRRSAIANRRAVTDAPFGSAKRPAQQLAEGIIQVPGSWDIVEVRQPDGVVVFEGPMTSNYSVKVLEDVKSRMGAPVKAVITTSGFVAAHWRASRICRAGDSHLRARSERPDPRASLCGALRDLSGCAREITQGPGHEQRLKDASRWEGVPLAWS